MMYRMLGRFSAACPAAARADVRQAPTKRNKVRMVKARYRDQTTDLRCPIILSRAAGFNCFSPVSTVQPLAEWSARKGDGTLKAAQLHESPQRGATAMRAGTWTGGIVILLLGACGAEIH